MTTHQRYEYKTGPFRGAQPGIGNGFNDEGLGNVSMDGWQVVCVWVDPAAGTQVLLKRPAPDEG